MDISLVFMKKALFFLLSGFLIIFLNGCGCGKKEDSSKTSSLSSTSTFSTNKSKNEPQLPVLRDSKPSDQIISEIASAGWQSRPSDPSTLGIYEGLSPVAVFTAKNENGATLLLSWFDSVNAAGRAYDSLLPSDPNFIKNEDGENFQQCVVTLPNQEGIWLFRHIGGCVFGGWAADSQEEAWLISVMDAFQS